ncbi:MAG: hypothetical protein EBU31_06345 [Proteobacteria bacterium]|nr:hypothetical protein [Pseudomonadota bacterium]
MQSSALSDSLRDISVMIAQEWRVVSRVRTTFACNAANAIPACGNVLGDPRGALHPGPPRGPSATTRSAPLAGASRSRARARCRTANRGSP